MDSAMTITLLIGAVPYRLHENSARWLGEMIRQFCVDVAGPLDLPARACLQLADVIAEDLERGSSPEPIELGRLHVDGLLAYVFRDSLRRGDEDLTTLCWGLQRFRVDPV
jgi:hypothetical protein